MRIELTRRICQDMRVHLRERADRVLIPTAETAVEYEALRRVAELLDRADDAARGNATLTLGKWAPDHLKVLREVLLATLEGCVQMQVRRALIDRLDKLDDHLGISAVERLGRLPP